MLPFLKWLYLGGKPAGHDNLWSWTHNKQKHDEKQLQCDITFAAKLKCWNVPFTDSDSYHRYLKAIWQRSLLAFFQGSLTLKSSVLIWLPINNWFLITKKNWTKVGKSQSFPLSFTFRSNRCAIAVLAATRACWHNSPVYTLSMSHVRVFSCQEFAAWLFTTWQKPIRGQSYMGLCTCKPRLLFYSTHWLRYGNINNGSKKGAYKPTTPGKKATAAAFVWMM